MLKLTIPGFGEVKIKHIVFDFNGTLAVDGSLIDGLQLRLSLLSKLAKIHVVTGDSCHTAEKELADIDCELTILPPENQTVAKANYIIGLDAESVVAIGNGRNDQQMLQAARIGIAVLGEEGLALAALSSADIVVPNIFSALALFRPNTRLLATLRS